MDDLFSRMLCCPSAESRQTSQPPPAPLPAIRLTKTQGLGPEARHAEGRASPGVSQRRCRTGEAPRPQRMPLKAWFSPFSTDAAAQVSLRG